jgi:transposase-like protein
LRGGVNPKAKLDDEKARAILRVRPDPIAAGDLSKSLAREHKVSESSIMRVWRRQTFAHVRLEEE